MTLDACGRSAAASLHRAVQADVEVQTMLEQMTRDNRRHKALAGGALLVAGIVIVAVGWALLRPLDTASVTPGTTTPAATPSDAPAGSSGSYTTTRFEDAFTVVVPDWVTEVTTPIDGAYQSATNVVWNRCTFLSECMPVSGRTWKHCPEASDCIALSFNRFSRLHAPGDPLGTYQNMPDYAGYVAFMQGLAGTGDVALSAVSTTTVGSRPTTLMTVTSAKDIAGGIGCYVGTGYGDDCVDLFSEVIVRMAVVDTGGTPLVVLTRTPIDNPMGQEWLGQFDQMLPTVEFTGATQP